MKEGDVIHNINNGMYYICASCGSDVFAIREFVGKGKGLTSMFGSLNNFVKVDMPETTLEEKQIFVDMTNRLRLGILKSDHVNIGGNRYTFEET